jgi:hypothetical protein
MLVVFFLVILLSSNGQHSFKELRLICEKDPDFWECYKLPDTVTNKTTATTAVTTDTDPIAEPIVNVTTNATVVVVDPLADKPDLVTRIATTFRLVTENTIFKFFHRIKNTTVRVIGWVLLGICCFWILNDILLKKTPLQSVGGVIDEIWLIFSGIFCCCCNACYVGPANNGNTNPTDQENPPPQQPTADSRLNIVENRNFRTDSLGEIDDDLIPYYEFENSFIRK